VPSAEERQKSTTLVPISHIVEIAAAAIKALSPYTVWVALKVRVNQQICHWPDCIDENEIRMSTASYDYHSDPSLAWKIAMTAKG
jgi:hypothetical protein